MMAAPAFADDAATKGLEIAKKADKANEGFVGETSKTVMVLIDAHGEKVTRKMTIKIKEGTDGDKSISEFHWPADVNGTKLLTWTHKSKDDDQWLFLPAIKRIKRISSRNKSGSFMGSEFAYEDLAAQEVEKFTYSLVAEEDFDGRKVWKNQRIPAHDKSGYSKQISYVDQEYLQPLKVEYFDRKGELLKVAAFEGYKKHGKFWRWTTIHMKNVQTKKQSILTWEARELGVEHEDDAFESDALED